jgi:DNA excision repair protein ERCC-4
VIISPTEPKALRDLGEVSVFPEEFGCDLLFATNGHWAGVQRKEFKDLVASIQDGRLGEQIAKMKASNLDYLLIVVEGTVKWTDSGFLVSKWGKGVSRSQVRKVLWTVRQTGVWIDYSESIDDTIKLVKAFEEWCDKEHHASLGNRPGPSTGWGKASNKEWLAHFLQGLPGVGAATAARMIEHFDGSPVAWNITKEQLLEIPGIGPKKVEAMWNALHA